MSEGPVLIAFDGSPSAEHAVRESGRLLGGRQAIVVCVYQEGIGLELQALPSGPDGLAPVPIDVDAANEIQQSFADRSQTIADQGAQLARAAGFVAEPLAVADSADADVGQALVRLARERGADAIVVGAHGHRGLFSALMGSTSRDVIRHAECPVVVVREDRGGSD